MYIPSYDFKLFKIPNFSPLEANEYNAMTQFSASTPLAYVDYSLNQLAGLMQPNAPNPYRQRQFPSEIIPAELQSFFQQPTETIDSLRDRLTRVRDESQRKLDELSGKTSTQDKTIIDPLDPYGSGKRAGETLSKSTITNPILGGKKLGEILNMLPPGSGIFLIAVVVIILLFIFVKT